MKTIIALVTLSLLLCVLLRRFKIVRFIDRRLETLPAMPSDKAERVLRGSVGKRVRIVFTDGVEQSVEVKWLDDEGFGYGVPDSAAYKRDFEQVATNPPQYWARFVAIASINASE